MNKTILSLVGLYLIMCMPLLSGCSKSKDMEDLERFVEQTKQTPAQPIEPLPTVKPIDKFSYTASQKRDPFVKVLQRNYNGIRPDMNRPKEPLEAYTLDSLQMVGILTEHNKTWGIIVAPDNTVYRVNVGSYLGQNFGKVTAITPTEIKILETIPQGDNWTQRETSLAIK